MDRHNASGAVDGSFAQPRSRHGRRAQRSVMLVCKGRSAEESPAWILY